MIDARFVPLEQWPGKPTAAHERRRASFRSPYAKTLDLLEAELNHLHALDITIQAFFGRQDIRNDGWPRSSAKPSAPGVILSFDQRSQVRRGANLETKVTEMSFPCDRFDSWEDNLRAIALSLEALRKIDRYGVTRSGEQYKGWARLEAPAGPDHMSPDQAAAFIAMHSNVKDASALLLNPNLRDVAYRTAVKALHPDAGGDHDLFLRLQKAKAILDGSTAGKARRVERPDRATKE